MTGAGEERGDTAFRTVERRYKLREGKAPDLAGVLRPARAAGGGMAVTALPGHPGAYHISRLLSGAEQEGLATEALCAYPDPAAGHDSNVPAEKRTWRGANGARHDKALRWVTMGYWYDWTEKTYDPAAQSPLPAALLRLAQAKYQAVRAAVLGSEGGGGAVLPEEVAFQTAIVNYYNHKSTLMGHTDTYEHPAVLEHPLLTISLGRSAVFLVGGPTKDTPPTPLLIASGDAVLLSGPSRVAYHGVPCVLPDTCPPPLAAAHPLLGQHRINISLRQVFPAAAAAEGEPAAKRAKRGDCGAAAENLALLQ